MAFRFGQHGSLTNKGVVWHCPTCNAENTGPLEQGCTACNAGRDAAKASIAKSVAAAMVLEDPTRHQVDLSPIRDVVNAYVAWREGLRVKDLPDAFDDQLQFAFTAGAAWQREQQAAPAGNVPAGDGGGTVRTPAATTGGWTVCLIDPSETLTPAPLDARAHATILAALIFYRDNTLSYGVVPGNLSAQECTQLITQLTPQETEA